MRLFPLEAALKVHKREGDGVAELDLILGCEP